MKIPDKLYHATTWKSALSIMDTGLKPLGADHLIYFTDTFAGAGTFAYMHGVSLEDIIVIEVDTTNLDKNLFDYGYDHNPIFFKDIKVYTYSQHIITEHISDYFVIDMKGDE